MYKNSIVYVCTRGLHGPELGPSSVTAPAGSTKEKHISNGPGHWKRNVFSDGSSQAGKRQKSFPTADPGYKKRKANNSARQSEPTKQR